MAQFVPAFISVIKGGAAFGAGSSIGATLGGAAAIGTKYAATSALTGAVTSAIAKKAAPKAPKTPVVAGNQTNQVSRAPTSISVGEQSQRYGDGQQMDLLSTVIAGKKRRNKLG
jgi:hypothetical protein|tara:strand:+ start:2463 stop:2804 length:342 start_codon:yes stop_codon:yes gene_type:complete